MSVLQHHIIDGVRILDAFRNRRKETLHGRLRDRAYIAHFFHSLRRLVARLLISVGHFLLVLNRYKAPTTIAHFRTLETGLPLKIILHPDKKRRSDRLFRILLLMRRKLEVHRLFLTANGR